MCVKNAISRIPRFSKFFRILSFQTFCEICNRIHRYVLCAVLSVYRHGFFFKCLAQAAQDALKDPVIAERIQKLAAAGILSFG